MNESVGRAQELMNFTYALQGGGNILKGFILVGLKRTVSILSVLRRLLELNLRIKCTNNNVRWREGELKWTLRHEELVT